MTKIKTIINAMKRVFSNKKYVLLFAFLFVLSAGIILYIPVLTIPGNTIAFQIGTFGLHNYLLGVLLAVFISLMISMNIYSYRKKSMKYIGAGAVGGISGFFAGVVATGTCASCLAPLLAVVGLGTGSAVFLLENQIYVALISLLILSVSVYFVSLKIERTCEVCK